MANPLIIDPTLTLAGQAAAFNADNTGIELIIDSISFGRAHYDPTGNEVALVDPVGSRVPLAGGSRPTPYQLRLNAAWREDVGQVPIGEIGYWSGNTLVFVWSRADGEVASYKTDGVTYVLFCDLALRQVPAGSINLVIDPTESVALAALGAHEGAHNAHPQYLLRADVAKDSGRLAWLGEAKGTANALLLDLVSAESELTAYGTGQRFQFKAKVNNTGPVTANIKGLGVIQVKKTDSAGLVDLEADDIRAGGLYDLNFDGTYFQLGGGVGASRAFQRFSFEASIGQTVFNARHNVGSLIVLRNGREITDYVSDGEKVTLRSPCTMGDAVEILAFAAFRSVDGYTKAEVQALLKTASALPVGSMLPFPRGVVPAGYLEVDGSVQKVATYPDLAAYLGGAFNKGDEPDGYFRLPDTRGEFLRGWDHGRGIDAGRSLGSSQPATIVCTGDPNKTSPGIVTFYNDQDDDSLAFMSRLNGDGTPGAISGVSANAILTSASSSAAGSSMYVRPRNVSVMWCIKAWDAPVNQGQIDVAALVEELAELRSSTPVGAIMPFPKAQVPSGYLELDGSIQSKAAYPDLSAYLGTTYNKGDEPAGFFRLPDYRGEFLRGWDHGRGVDAGRGAGTSQLDALQNITGSMKMRPTPSNYAVGAIIGGDGAFGATSAGGITGGAAAIVLSSEYANFDKISFDASKVARTADETRPRDVSVMWCIKAWSAPVNQGHVDVAALVEELNALRSSTPVGAILPFPKAKVPAGYLELDGSIQNATAYPDLAAYLSGAYNKGDEPAGYFRLPDYRGEFLRGWDHGRGTDAARTLGSTQADALKSHGHGAPMWASTSFDSTGGPYFVGADTGGAPTGTNYSNLLAAGGDETRPRNVSVMWCIKAWSAPVNQGVVDVGALAADVQALAPARAVAGDTRNARMDVPALSANVTWKADELIVKTAPGGLGWALSNLSVDVNLAAVGAGGMNISPAPASGYVAIYVLYNPVSKSVAGLAVNATAGAVPEVYSGAMPPGGYSASALVTVVPTDAGGKFLPVSVKGRSVACPPTQPFLGAAPVNMAPISLAASVPPNAVSAEGLFSVRSSQPGAVSIELYSTTNATGIKRNTATVVANGTQSIMFENLPIVTRQLMYLTAVNLTPGTPEYSVYITGYRV